jgi:hypothetical protein
MTFVALKYANEFRILMPNEGYYREYDDVKGRTISVDYDDEDTPFEYS